jgi:hypothetical protein
MKKASPLNNRKLLIKDSDYYLVLANDKGLALIDSDKSYLSKFNWSLSKDGYAVAWIDGKVTKLHHALMGKPTKGMVIDHINRSKLDNTVQNLRLTTQKTNMRNTGMFNTNTSGHKGVTWDKRTSKWIAQAFFDGKYRFGGRFSNIKDAVKARQRLEQQFN